MSDRQDGDPRPSDAHSGEPPETQGSGEGSGSALSAMLKKRREGQHGIAENPEDQDSGDGACTN